ncbi:MAG TPA: NAD(P)/FAD-dependent oxidoreductase [Solirubrobacteraceae bacterium]|nr:NAD(P)/FAD-dependent oxidoreductase [Solirubrobacteraceae bacterium]
MSAATIDSVTRPDREVAIIGAGLGGIGAAIALTQAGIEDIVILERASDIGGTWRDNTYPGLTVDIPAQAYQFSYQLKPDWSHVYARGREVKDYIDQCADRWDVRRFVRLNSEVLSRTWDEESHLWQLELPGGEELTARFVISAIGAFVNPKPPDLEGLDAFGGDVLHSAAWDHSVELSGRRAAIVGTGASALQIIPEVAPKLRRLDVYQRTPIWVGPKLDLRTPRAVQRLYRRFPGGQDAVRKATTRVVEAGLVGLVVNHDEIGWITRGAGWLARNVWYRSQVRDPWLRRRLTPDYEVGCKRPSVSNTYLSAFGRANVELICEPIERITADAVRAADGRDRAVDVLILATGFRMATDPENYRSNPVRGRGGFDLATFYAEQHARSYESVSLPGLPNHFMIFGPYGWTGGTWHQLVETAAHHIARVLLETRRRGATAVEVREEAAESWTRFAVQRLGRSLWRTGSCQTANSYYFDRHGDTPFLRPTSARQAWHAARSFPLDDYRFETIAPTPVSSSDPATAATMEAR